MSISSFTMVTMLDSRPSPITISMPRTNDIPNRVITFKDIYGSAVSNSITLVTQGGDVFENGLFSTIMSNAFDTVTFHAGLPGRWHRTAGTIMVGGTSASSTFTNSLSTASIYAKTFYGDGSQLTGVLTTGGTTTFSNIVAITSISNAGWLSNTGPVRFGGGLSNSGVLCNTGTATFGNTLGVTGVLTPSGGIAGAAGISNTGLLSNTGLAYIGGTLGVTGAATFANTVNITNALTPSGGITGAAGISNTGLLSNTGYAYFGNTLGVTGAATFANTVGITNLLTTSAGISNTGLISTQTLNSGSISTLQLAATSATVSSLTFYDPTKSAFSTGTFRYSTLTTLFALPNTSLLYFNNFVVAGAYVWPGQLIQSLDWTTSLTNQTLQSVSNGNTFGTSGTWTYYVASNVIGGSPPYSFLDRSATALSLVGLSISNNSANTAFGLLTGTMLSNLTPTTFTVSLSDSSTPAFVRNISFQITSQVI